MSQQSSSSADAPTDAASPTQPDGSQADVSRSETNLTRQRRLAIQLAAACLAAMAGIAGAETIAATQELFHVPSGELGMPPQPPEIQRRIDIANLKNAMIGFGAANALVCAAIGLVLGATSGSLPRFAGILSVGLLAGGLAGAIGGPLTHWTYARLRESGLELDAALAAMILHAGNYVLLGIAAGLVTAIAVGSWRKLGWCLTAAILAGAVAAVVHPVVSSTLFPGAHPELAVPFEFEARLVWYGFSSAIVAWTAANVAVSPKHRSAG